MAGLRIGVVQDPDLRICLELHPGTCVFSVPTFTRLAALGPSVCANLDPSHFFWMGMDGHREVDRLLRAAIDAAEVVDAAEAVDIAEAAG